MPLIIGVAMKSKKLSQKHSSKTGANYGLSMLLIIRVAVPCWHQLLKGPMRACLTGTSFWWVYCMLTKLGTIRQSYLKLSTTMAYNSIIHNYWHNTTTKKDIRSKLTNRIAVMQHNYTYIFI